MGLTQHVRSHHSRPVKRETTTSGNGDHPIRKTKHRANITPKYNLTKPSHIKPPKNVSSLHQTTGISKSSYREKTWVSKTITSPTTSTRSRHLVRDTIPTLQILWTNHLLPHIRTVLAVSYTFSTKTVRTTSRICRCQHNSAASDVLDFRYTVLDKQNKKTLHRNRRIKSKNITPKPQNPVPEKATIIVNIDSG